MYRAFLLFAIFGASNVLARPLDLQTEAASVDARTFGKRSASAQTTPTDWAHGGDCASDNLTGCVGGHGETVDSAAPPHSASSGGSQKRWITPPTVPIGFGTECSLETCDMCPTFPGCSRSDGSQDPSNDNSSDLTNDQNSNSSLPKAKDQKRWITPIHGPPTEVGTTCSLETCDMCPSFPGCGTGQMRAGHKPPQPTVDSAKEKRAAQEDAPATTPVTFKKGNWEQPPVLREKRGPIVVSGGVVVGADPECSVLTCDLCPDHPGCLDGGQTWDDGDSDDEQGLR